MAKLEGGILGTVRGKVSGVVAATWKNKNYVRQHVKPANPNSAAQQAQRALFGNCVTVAKLVLGQVINPFWDPFQKSQSGFNAFIKTNIDACDYPRPTTTVKLTTGKLYFEQGITPTYSGNVITSKWSTNVGTNGLATDKVFLVVYEVDPTDQEIIQVAFSASAARSAGATGVTATLSASKTTDSILRCFTFAVQYEAADPAKAVLLVSYSVGDTAEAA